MNFQPDSAQLTKAQAFKDLHERAGIFVVPNPWDAGSAKMLQSIGFKALATTSAGLAFSLGKADGEGSVTLQETLENARSIVAAVNVPVSADLENGYGIDPEVCAETILLAARAGLAGGSIEDTTGRPEYPILPFDLSVERVKAAVKAAKSLPFPFMLTARAENLIYGRPDLKDTIKRLEAFADAGADVLFAPGIKTPEEIALVVKAVAPRPVNVVMGLNNCNLSLTQLEDLGVKRVSLGSSLARAAYSAFINGAKEILQHGTFNFASDTIPYDEINKLFK
ncbi:isocitrate lyase/PEP mutase family protein [Mucilaginibacter gotjawali]|uniref:Carboxyvinyl-carboxyphosphonate phosphorylmutase n=2 Tax=Mucilaginibacter gotjawali TaxID=1550579 RepID=A0A0X8X0L4_9SPHI|nr:isocitrate lyase/phosphoenolpyruvate mutase family protein [Mucilaginibacter gotjawali]MBB3056193.1 2-methylisocitrate lyase-like PEP mutase family enzyme [Mucilaginibacter gotjawali]BAU53465.1 Carboxyvinyl-carboxyphosphonate phosphorylmutase [Mucilaginibacter gotjawali]